MCDGSELAAVTAWKSAVVHALNPIRSGDPPGHWGRDLGDPVVVVQVIESFRAALAAVTRERDALKVAFDGYKTWLGGMEQDRDEYRQKVVDLRAEVERLRAEWQTMEKNWIIVGKENERLRALLREWQAYITGPVDFVAAQMLHDKTSAALGEGA